MKKSLETFCELENNTLLKRQKLLLDLSNAVQSIDVISDMNIFIESEKSVEFTHKFSRALSLLDSDYQSRCKSESFTLINTDINYRNIQTEMKVDVITSQNNNKKNFAKKLLTQLQADFELRKHGNRPIIGNSESPNIVETLLQYDSQVKNTVDLNSVSTDQIEIDNKTTGIINLIKNKIPNKSSDYDGKNKKKDTYYDDINDSDDDNCDDDARNKAIIANNETQASQVNFGNLDRVNKSHDALIKNNKKSAIEKNENMGVGLKDGSGTSDSWESALAKAEAVEEFKMKKKVTLSSDKSRFDDEGAIFTYYKNDDNNDNNNNNNDNNNNNNNYNDKHDIDYNDNTCNNNDNEMKNDVHTFDSDTLVKEIIEIIFEPEINLNVPNLINEKKLKFRFTKESLLILFSKYDEDEKKNRSRFSRKYDDDNRKKNANSIFDSDDDSDSDCDSEESNTKNNVNKNNNNDFIPNSSKKIPNASECECVLTDLFFRKDARSYLLQYLDKKRCRNAQLTMDGFSVMSIIMQVKQCNHFIYILFNKMHFFSRFIVICIY